MLGINIRLNGSVAAMQCFGLTNGTDKVFEGVIQEQTSEWDGYAKVVIINQGEESITVPVIENVFEVPTKSLAYGQFTLGVIGRMDDKTLYSKTCNGFIYNGAYAEVEVPKDIWLTYLETMDKYLKRIIESENTVSDNKDVVLDKTEEVKTLVDEFNVTVVKRTNEFNNNSNDKTNAFNDNAESKTNDFNTNASDKKEIIDNASDEFLNNVTDKTNEFNDNVAEKTKTYNTNAVDKTDVFNANATEKGDLFDSKFDGIDDKVVLIAGHVETSKEIQNEISDMENNVEEMMNTTNGYMLTTEEYKKITNQAMTDLLRIIGEDIATLTNGKLTPSQLPDISINDSFLIADESELTGLDAQTGDMAYLENEDGEVTGLYWLVGENTAENWKKLGLSFVAESGHAETADTATNATMINNKRIVGMTDEQYATAITDEDTYYFTSGVSTNIDSVMLTQSAYDQLDNKPEDVIFYTTEEVE